MTLQQLLLVKPSSQLLKNVSEDNSDLATLDVAEVKLNMIFALTSNDYTVRTLAVSYMRCLNKNCAIRKTLIQCFKNKQTTSAAFPDTLSVMHWSRLHSSTLMKVCNLERTYNLQKKERCHHAPMTPLLAITSLEKQNLEGHMGLVKLNPA